MRIFFRSSASLNRLFCSSVLQIKGFMVTGLWLSSSAIMVKKQEFVWVTVPVDRSSAMTLMPISMDEFPT